MGVKFFGGFGFGERVLCSLLVRFYFVRVILYVFILELWVFWRYRDVCLVFYFYGNNDIYFYLGV